MFVKYNFLFAFFCKDYDLFLVLLCENKQKVSYTSLNFMQVYKFRQILKKFKKIMSLFRFFLNVYI